MADNEQFWAEWDVVVDDYITKMKKARFSHRMLKQRQAQTYSSLKKSGMGVEDAKNAVFDNEEYQLAWAESDVDEIEEKQARLKLDKLQLRFEEWRSRNATKRAEMTLR